MLETVHVLPSFSGVINVLYHISEIFGICNLINNYQNLYLLNSMCTDTL